MAFPGPVCLFFGFCCCCEIPLSPHLRRSHDQKDETDSNVYPYKCPLAPAHLWGNFLQD